MQGSSLGLLRSPRLERAGFKHAFTTRLGGVSKPPFDALDFAVLRDPSALAENQRRLGEGVGFEPSNLHQTVQVHGNVLRIAAGEPRDSLAHEADALVAEPGSGHAVAVRVADCVPVLVGCGATGRAAAIHAGWRGVENGMVKVAVGHLAKDGAASGMVAAIGPCIGPCCFEVGADVGARIVASVADPLVIDRHVDDKAFVDLRRAVRAQLRALGIPDDAIDDVPGTGRSACTRCDRERYYSYRRDGDASGRLIAVIMARP